MVWSPTLLQEHIVVVLAAILDLARVPLVVAVAVSGSQDTVAVVHLVVAEKATVVVVVLSTLEAVVALQLLGTSRPDTAAVVARLVAEKAVVGLVASKMEAVVCAAWALLLGTSCQVVAAWTGGHC